MSWIALVLAVSVVVGLLRGGRLGNLKDVHLSGWPLLVVGVVLSAAAAFIPDDRTWSGDVGVGLILAAYFPLFGVVALNRNEPGMWLAGIGILANFTVIALNAGMPVLEEAARFAGAEGVITTDAKHVLADEGSRLLFLGDVIPLQTLGQVISLGDVFLGVGIARYLSEQMRMPAKYFRRTGSSVPGSAAPH